jgi:anti-sigma factor RsiW
MTMADEQSGSSEQPDPDRPPEAPSAEARDERAEPASRPSMSARIALGAVRLIALVGVVALAVIAGAILVGQDVDGWIVGLVIGLSVQILTIVVLFSRRFAPPD